MNQQQHEHEQQHERMMGRWLAAMIIGIGLFMVAWTWAKIAVHYGLTN